MNYMTETRGEKTVKALAKRLLEAEGNKHKSAARKTAASGEMEAALLRLNPHLGRIADLEKGTPILLPENFPLAREESSPVFGDAADAIEESEAALQAARDALADSVEQVGQQGERVQEWLKSDGAKEILRRLPDLKEAFASGGAAAKTLRREQTALADAEAKKLEEVRAELARFRESLGR